VRISVVTVCCNAAATIEDTVRSVADQTYPDVEHIVIDGASTDGTSDIIGKFESNITKWVSEPDQGIYDAMNKGIALASGDVVGFLNADDIYAHPEVLAEVAQALGDESIQAVYGDVVFVRDDLHTTVRYYRSHRFTAGKLAWGWMPPHPSIFIRKHMFDKYGLFKTNYRIAADYELVTRLFARHKMLSRYMPGVSVKMRVGGVSTRSVKSNYILSQEIVRACRENGINTNLIKVSLKYPFKMMELIFRPSKSSEI